MHGSTTAREVGYPVARTLSDAIEMNAIANPQAPAIVFPDGTVLTYDALQQQIRRVGTALSSARLGARDRVAIVLPDGPELAITIAAVACHATIVPLNPELTAIDIDDLFASLQVNGVVVAEGAEIPARDAALRHNTCLFEASAQGTGVELTLRSPPLTRVLQDIAVGPDDPAMILRTSGTTARPKLVPVTHRNLLAMAMRLQGWFDLVPSDRVLCVMPLHYAQGLKNALFVPLILGSSLACPRRSSDTDFFSWLSEHKPTWYSAGPTLHRAVLDRARTLPDAEFSHSLRFIQSAAAPLPDAIHDGLETVFGIPVLDSYGLSEAGLVAAGSVAPEGRKRGTVGKPWCGELAIKTEDGAIFEIGGPGEIVVRGPGVTPGYVDDSEANRAAFTDGWFHTGDLGRIDSDGFLTVVGRIKDLINRGGEKVAPAEIDQALLRHHAVLEAAAFSIPHTRLGEDVIAAVVLRSGAAATSLELRQFLQTILVPFKIPRRIHIVTSLPKGDTGKIRRPELARLFGTSSARRSSVDWRWPLEIEIAEVWQRLLGRESIGPEDDFFDLGGDSLLATKMLVELEHLTGRRLPQAILFDNATIRQLAESLAQNNAEANQSLLVQLQPGVGKVPFIYIDGDWAPGNTARKLARLLGSEWPFYCLRSHGLLTDRIPSIEQMAQDYKEALDTAGLQGPFRLGGHCNGALIALELAHQLEAAHRDVELVAIIDPLSLNARTSMRLVVRVVRAVIGLAARDAEKRQVKLGSAMSKIWNVVGAVSQRWQSSRPFRKSPVWWTAKATKFIHQLIARKANDGLDGVTTIGMRKVYYERMASYIPSPVAADLLCMLAESNPRSVEFSGMVWRNFARHSEIILVPGDHDTCVTAHAEVVTSHLRARLAALDRLC
jgi:oxalate---CoA ligase